MSNDLFTYENIEYFLTTVGWDMVVSMPFTAQMVMLCAAMFLFLSIFITNDSSYPYYRTTLRDKLIRLRKRLVIISIFVVVLLGICVWQFLSVPQVIAISGKVVNADSREWLNNRLILVFLNNKEVGRAITQVGEFKPSRRGAHDGLYVAELNNVYGLTLYDLYEINNPIVGIGNQRTVEHGRLLGFLPTTERIDNLYLYHWMDEILEGGQYRLDIPSKNTAYVVKVLAGDARLLPEGILNYPVELRENGALVSLDGNAQQGEFLPNVSVKNVYTGLKSEQSELKNVTIPLNNCGGSAAVNQRISYTQTFIHEYTRETQVGISLEIPLGVWLNIVPELQTRYGFQQGEIASQTVEYVLAAEPGTNQVYTIVWKEVWESGIAEVALGSDLLTAPFRAKTGLVYETNSVAYACP